MAYSKAKFESNGGKQSPCFKTFWKVKDEANIYLYRVYYVFHLNTI
jgi:hypothetical protein